MKLIWLSSCGLLVNLKSEWSREKANQWRMSWLPQPLSAEWQTKQPRCAASPSILLLFCWPAARHQKERKNWMVSLHSTFQRNDWMALCLALPSTIKRLLNCWLEWAAVKEKKWNQFHQFHSFKRMEWNGFTFLSLIINWRSARRVCEWRQNEEQTERSEVCDWMTAAGMGRKGAACCGQPNGQSEMNQFIDEWNDIAAQLLFLSLIGYAAAGKKTINSLF